MIKVKSIIFFVLFPFCVIAQEYEVPKIVPKKIIPFSPIKYGRTTLIDSVIVSYMNKDTSLIYFIEMVYRPTFLDLRVIGLKSEELANSPDLLHHLSVTYRYYLIEGKKIPITLFYDKEFGGATWTYTGDVLLIKQCIIGVTRTFKWAKIEKYENLKIDEECL